MRMTPKASRTLAGIAALVAALSSTLLAQWPNHPDPSVPRSDTAITSGAAIASPFAAT